MTGEIVAEKSKCKVEDGSMFLEWKKTDEGVEWATIEEDSLE